MRDGLVIVLRHNQGKRDYYFQGTSERSHEEWAIKIENQIIESLDSNTIGNIPAPKIKNGRKSISSLQSLSRRKSRNRSKSTEGNEHAGSPKSPKLSRSPKSSRAPKVFGIPIEKVKFIDESLLVPQIVVDTCAYLENHCKYIHLKIGVI